MTVTFSLHEAKAKLSHLVTLAEAGETVEITRHGKVRQVPAASASSQMSGPGSTITQRSTVLHPCQFSDVT